MIGLAVWSSGSNAVLPTHHTDQPITSVSDSEQALQKMQEPQPEMIAFLTTSLSNMDDLNDRILDDKGILDYVSRLSSESRDSTSTRSSRYMRRGGKSRKVVKTKVQNKNSSN